MVIYMHTSFTWIIIVLLMILDLHVIFPQITSAPTGCPLHERNALLDFKLHAVEEDPASYWLSSWAVHPGHTSSDSSSPNAAAVLDCCKWTGVMCNEQGSVIGIDLDNCVSSSVHMLRGELNPDAMRALASISGLSHLDFGCHHFHGSIAAEIGNLTSLTFLRLHRNNMSGLLPASMQSLTSLQHIGLGYNHFSPQEIPSSILHPSLISLNLYANNFIGPIPDVFMNLTNIEILNLYNNRLSGLLPQSLQYLTSATTIDLSNNKFSPQEIPSTLLRLPQLMALGLSNTNLRGAIPDSITNLTKIVSIDLSQNQLEGLLPPSMQYLRTLQTLDLSYNQFSPQEIPSTILFLPFLTLLDLSFNNFTGFPFSSPTDVDASFYGQESQLKYLILASNKLNDSLFHEASTFRFLKNLNALVLEDNQLQGPFPPSLNNVMSELLLLNMNGNRLQGPIPSFIRSLKKIKVLDLGSNDLNGSIPDWVGSSLEELRILILSGNHLTGAIPASLGLLKAMKSFRSSYNNTVKDVLNGIISTYAFPVDIPIPIKGQMLTFNDLQLVSALDISDNQMSGSIPADLGDLKGLLSLNLSVNHLDGEIPGTLGTLAHLESLDLSRNMLQGHIPRTFADLEELEFVNLSSNHLSGGIPNSPHWDTFGYSSFLHNDGLCTRNANIIEGLPMCSFTSPTVSSRPSRRSRDTFQLEDMMEWGGFIVGYSLGLLLGFLLVWIIVC